MIEMKLLVLTMSSALFWVGGYCWHNARRFILPILLTLTCWLLSKDIWSLTMLTTCGTFCLGYGEKSPLRHIFGNGWGRGIWGLLSALCLSTALFLTHHLALPLFLAYLAINFTLENALKNFPQFIGDPLIGMGFAAIILFI